MTSNASSRPVAGMPNNSPRCVPRSVFPRRDLVSFGDLIVDLDLQIRERRAQDAVERVDHPFRSRRRAWRRGPVDEVVGDELAKYGFVPLLDHLPVETEDDFLVSLQRFVLVHHESSSVGRLPAHCKSASSAGQRACPQSVKRYSTLGGT
jgi:hypothetical protein